MLFSVVSVVINVSPQHLGTMSFVQLWVGKRNSSGKTLNELRDTLVSQGYAWSVEDHGYNIGYLSAIFHVCCMFCLLLWTCMFFFAEDSTASWRSILKLYLMC